jgi:hypothetical protein
MIRVLRYLEGEGRDQYGRLVAQGCKMPYPQTYSTLNLFERRGFIRGTYVETGSHPRKTYRLTEAGQVLLSRINSTPVDQLSRSAQRPRSAAVDPDVYRSHTQIGIVYRWLYRHNVVASYPELLHMVDCAECNRLVSQYGLDSDIRCPEAAQKINDKEWA